MPSRRSLSSGLAVFLVLGVAGSLSLRASHLRDAAASQEIHLQSMRRNAQDILALRAGGAAAQSLDPTSLGELERSAEASGLKSQITGMTQNGADGVVVTLQRASFNRLVAWLDDLRLNRGIRVKRAAIEDASDKGAVNARLVLG